MEDRILSKEVLEKMMEAAKRGSDRFKRNPEQTLAIAHPDADMIPEGDLYDESVMAPMVAPSMGEVQMSGRRPQNFEDDAAKRWQKLREYISTRAK
jgi:hypothetical protein